MASSWAKMSSDLDSNPKVRKAGRNGREVFLFVLRRNAALDLGGRIPSSHVEPWYLADQLMMSEEDAVSGLSQAVRTGLLVDEGDQIAIGGWDDDWAKRPLTEAERKKLQRAKSKASEPMSGHCPDTPGQKTDSPESHVREERREEEKGVEKIIPSEVSEGKAKRKAPAVVLPADWSPTAEHAVIAGERGVDVAIEARRFRLHAEANDRRAVRWNAAFSQWLLKATPDRSGPYQAQAPVGGFAPPRLL